MSKKKIAVRIYTMADADLIQEAHDKVISIKRDIVDFNTRGVTLTNVTDYEAVITDFDEYPTDIELEGVVTEATQNKDFERDNILVKMRTIRTMAQENWGVEGAKYRIYGIEGMDKLTDNDLHRCGKRVVRIATGQLTDLGPRGLTTTMITDLSDANGKFDEYIDDQSEAIQNRDLATQTRVEKGNGVYEPMVTFCTTGKDLYASTNEAKYNDYVIYDKPAPVPPVPPVPPMP